MNRMELVRFLAVAVIGLGVDVAISWSLAELAGMRLGLAASCGFCVAAAVNYVLHELWTFQTGDRQLSALRAVKYLGALALTLAVRLVALAVLQRSPLLADLTLVLLVLATGVSFVANFLASKLLVFTATKPAGD